ncbi:hypothetical protein I4U23_027281 [Adineta vaga]|nr:hypothetical protein I4U23_027281 [Adineta vaga]
MVLDDTFHSTQFTTNTLTITAPASNKLSINAPTTNTLNMSNLSDKSNRSTMDLFNESIGEILCERRPGDKSIRAAVIDDIHNYRNYVVSFNLKHKPDVTSAAVFWQAHGTNFSILSKLSKIMLSSPATSVPSESCFSISSYLGRKERSRLTGENLSASVFLKDKINL